MKISRQAKQLLGQRRRIVMRQQIAIVLGILAMLGMDACSSSEPATSGGTGGAVGSGGKAGTGGAVGSGGKAGTGGAVGSGGKTGSGGSSAAGTGGAGGLTGACPYKVTSFSCDSACAKLNAFSAKCANDPTVPSDVQIMLSLYGEVPVVCTNTCAIVSPSSQTQWGCFQGVPDDVPCSAIAGCTATNCP
jgi:hypothetical protein